MWELFGKMTELELYRLDNPSLDKKMEHRSAIEKELISHLREKMDTLFGEYNGVRPSMEQAVTKLKAQLAFCYHVMAAGVNNKYENHIC